MQQFIFEILKITIPALLVLVMAYLIIDKFLIKETERQRLAIFQQNASQSLNLRLQAYERLSIFVERMHPSSMIGRYYNQQATAHDIQLAMVQGIRAEWEHNVSQQLYVSSETWMTIKTVMEQEITMLNRVGASLPLGAPASDFIKLISDQVLSSEYTMPTAIALEQLNKEAKFLLFGS